MLTSLLHQIYYYDSNYLLYPPGPPFHTKAGIRFTGCSVLQFAASNTSLAWFIIRTFWASVPDTLDRSAVCTRPPKQGGPHAPRDELLALATASRALGGLAREDCHLWRRFVTLALAPREHGLALVLWCERQCVRGGSHRLRWGNIL